MVTKNSEANMATTSQTHSRRGGSRTHLLACQFRSRAPQPLELTIRELVRRHHSRRMVYENNHLTYPPYISITTKTMMKNTGLTKKQVRSAMECLRKAKLILFLKQHNGPRKGWSRADYDCTPLIEVLSQPRPSRPGNRSSTRPRTPLTEKTSEPHDALEESDYLAYLEERDAQRLLTSGVGHGFGTPRYLLDPEADEQRWMHSVTPEELAEREVEQRCDELAEELREQEVVYDPPSYDPLREAEADALAVALETEEFIENFARASLISFNYWNIHPMLGLPFEPSDGSCLLADKPTDPELLANPPAWTGYAQYESILSGQDEARWEEEAEARAFDEWERDSYLLNEGLINALVLGIPGEGEKIEARFPDLLAKVQAYMDSLDVQVEHPS